MVTEQVLKNLTSELQPPIADEVHVEKMDKSKLEVVVSRGNYSIKVCYEAGDYFFPTIKGGKKRYKSLNSCIEIIDTYLTLFATFLDDAKSVADLFEKEIGVTSVYQTFGGSIEDGFTARFTILGSDKYLTVTSCKDYYEASYILYNANNKAQVITSLRYIKTEQGYIKQPTLFSYLDSMKQKYANEKSFEITRQAIDTFTCKFTDIEFRYKVVFKTLEQKVLFIVDYISDGENILDDFEETFELRNIFDLMELYDKVYDLWNSALDENSENEDVLAEELQPVEETTSEETISEEPVIEESVEVDTIPEESVVEEVIPEEPVVEEVTLEESADIEELELQDDEVDEYIETDEVDSIEANNEEAIIEESNVSDNNATEIFTGEITSEPFTLGDAEDDLEDYLDTDEVIKEETSLSEKESTSTSELESAAEVHAVYSEELQLNDDTDEASDDVSQSVIEEEKMNTDIELLSIKKVENESGSIIGVIVNTSDAIYFVNKGVTETKLHLPISRLTACETAKIKRGMVMYHSEIERKMFAQDVSDNEEKLNLILDLLFT